MECQDASHGERDVCQECGTCATCSKAKIGSLERSLNVAKAIARRLTKGETTVQDAAFWEDAAHANMDRANKLEEWLRTTNYAMWELARKEGVIQIAIGAPEQPHHENCDVNDPIIKTKPCNCRGRS